MVLNVQRKLTAGNRKSQLACVAVVPHVQTAVFPVFPTGRCHLDVLKWIVHVRDVHLASFFLCTEQNDAESEL